MHFAAVYTMVGYSPWGLKELDMTEQLHFPSSWLPLLLCPSLLICQGHPSQSPSPGWGWVLIFQVSFLQKAFLGQVLPPECRSLAPQTSCINSLTLLLWQRRRWHPTPVLLPGKSHGRRSLYTAVHGVAKSRTRLSDFPFTFHFHALEKEMATHSSVLAWRIPGTGEPGGLPSMGLHRVGHDWSDLAAACLDKFLLCPFLKSFNHK